MEWGASSIRFEGECWDQLAKWPDGQHFLWEDAFEEADIPSNVEINKKNKAWAADSIPERNRWVRLTLKELQNCEPASPLMQRIALRAADIWASLEGSLPIIFLPPLLLLITASIVGWIVKGFRANV